jgi:hypothetical protein
MLFNRDDEESAFVFRRHPACPECHGEGNPAWPRQAANVRMSRMAVRDLLLRFAFVGALLRARASPDSRVVLPLPFVVILSGAFFAESKDLASTQFILRRHPEAVHSEACLPQAGICCCFCGVRRLDAALRSACPEARREPSARCVHDGGEGSAVAFSGDAPSFAPALLLQRKLRKGAKGGNCAAAACPESKSKGGSTPLCPSLARLGGNEGKQNRLGEKKAHISVD